MIFLNSVNSLRYEAKNLTNKIFYAQKNQKLLNQLNKQEIKLLVKIYKKSFELFQLVDELDKKCQRRKNRKKYSN